MVKKLILLNLALLGLAVWLVYRLDASLKRDARRGDGSKLTAPSPPGKAPAKPELSKDKPNGPPAPPALWETEYGMVADKNLFSEDRSRVKVTDNTPVKPPIPDLNPKPVLIAILQADNKKMALIEASGPASHTPTPGPPRYTRPNQPVPNPNMAVVTHMTGAHHEPAVQLEVGQEYKSGYKVTEIADTTVTLAYGNNERVEKLELYSRDRAARPGRVPPPPPMVSPTPTPAGQVFQVGGSSPTPPAPGGQAPPVRQGTPAGAPNTAPRPSGAAVNAVNPITPMTPATPTPGAPATAPAVTAVGQGTPAPGGAPNTNTGGGANSSGERATPWGKIKTPRQ